MRTVYYVSIILKRNICIKPIPAVCGPNTFAFPHWETGKLCAPIALRYLQIHCHWLLSRVFDLAVIDLVGPRVYLLENILLQL